MKGRGTRTISPTDLKAVTPDVDHKTHFMIVDAIGVCETDKTDSISLERKRNVPFDKLLKSIALGVRDDDTISSLAGRLARLDRKCTVEEKKEIEASTGGIPLTGLINHLLDAIDPDKQIEKAKELFKTDNPDEKQAAEAKEALVATAAEPFDNPETRDLFVRINSSHEQVIDNVSRDEVDFAGFDEKAKKKARGLVDSFRRFIGDKKDEIAALQIIYNQPYTKRHITFDDIRELAGTMSIKPNNLSIVQVWKAYEQLEKSRVRGHTTDKVLANIISLVRFAIGKVNILEPFSVIVDERFTEWLRVYEDRGVLFTAEQLQWLEMIKDHVATSLSIEIDDFELSPFHEKGGAIKVKQVFGDDFDTILEELNEVLVA
jgi:type I restriction enzyme R subunit